MKTKNDVKEKNSAIELAKKIASGDKKAEQDFVQKHYKWLLFIIRKDFPDFQYQEDVAQETFLIVLDSLSKNKVRNFESIYQFMKKTAHFTSLNFSRKSKSLIEPHEKFFEEVVTDIDILSSLEWEESKRNVKKLIESLSIPRDREILLQYYYYGIDKHIICQNLDLAPKHFDRVVHRARERLKVIVMSNNNIKPTKLNISSVKHITSLVFITVFFISFNVCRMI